MILAVMTQVSSNWQGAVEMVRRVATATGRQRHGRFSIEGLRLHERALRAGVPLEQVLVGERLWQAESARVQQLLAELATAVPNLITIPDTVMSDLTNGRDLGGLLGLIPLPDAPSLAEVLSRVPKPLLLVAVEVVDPGNVGALLRTGHASGITAFVAVGRSDPFHPKAVRTAMGSLFKVPVVTLEDIAPLLTLLQNQGIETVGTAVQDGTLLPQANFSERGTAVFMGNEYWGLPPELQTQLNTLVTIPMAEGIDSFSVNAAAAIIFYEIQQPHLQPPANKALYQTHADD